MFYLLTVTNWQSWADETIQVLLISIQLGAKIYPILLGFALFRAIVFLV